MLQQLRMDLWCLYNACFVLFHISNFSVPTGGRVGSRRKSDWCDAASACSRCLCKSLSHKVIPLLVAWNTTASDFTSSTSLWLIGSQPRSRGAGRPAGAWGGLHHQIWWLLWCTRYTNQGIPNPRPSSSHWATFLFYNQTCAPSPVPHRWNAGAGDDVRSSSEKIQVHIAWNKTYLLRRWLSLDFVLLSSLLPVLFSATLLFFPVFWC